MRNKKLRYGGNGMIAAVVLVMTVMVLLSGCEQTAPEKEVDTYEELVEALSGPEDFDIILPDTESLGAVDLEHSRYMINLYNQDRRVHIGYSISMGIKELPHLRGGSVFCHKPGYLTFAGSVPQDEEPLDPNMEYAGVPIEYIRDDVSPASVDEIDGQQSDEGSYSIYIEYAFDTNGCRYELSAMQDFLAKDSGVIETDIKKAGDILLDIAKNIIDKGTQQSGAVGSEEQ